MSNSSVQTGLLSAFAFLLMLSLMMVFSSSAVLADTNYGDSLYFVKRQLIFVGVALVATYVCYSVRTSLYKEYSLVFYVIGLVLLLIVLVPGIGKSAGGAARWIAIGSFRLQGGEVFKLSLVIFLAASLAKKDREMHTFRVGLVPHLIFPGLAMGLLLLEPDFGTTFLVATVTFVVLFVGGARIAYLLALFIVALPLGFHAIASSPYRLGRVIAFLDPWAHRHDIGYQVVESLITFGSGQLWGLGLGEGSGKLFFLPAAHTDFILAVIGEELGFLGVVLVLLAYATIGVCGMKIALTAKERHSALLATGLTAMILLQAIFNFFVVMGLAPTKGVTLPFVSYGGSSLLISAVMIGILLRIAFESATQTSSQVSA